MKYTVTIKNNETGAIEKEVDCNAIIAGISMGDGEAASLAITSCNGKELLAAYKSTEKAINEIVKKNPILLLADMFAHIEKEDTDNA